MHVRKSSDRHRDDSWLKMHMLSCFGLLAADALPGPGSHHLGHVGPHKAAGDDTASGTYARVCHVVKLLENGTLQTARYQGT